MEINTDIIVSICCIAYNQEKYIRQCLDSFMMQKTNFKFEVLINDDASTDGTADIIREYEQKYPDIIKPIYQTQNQWSKGISVGATFNYPRVKGKYIAMCEGDDYWTDQYKLQKQFDIMEANPEYSICFHDVQVTHESKKREDYIFPTKKIKENCSEFNFDNLLFQNFIQTNSVMYRVSSYPEFWKDIPSNIIPGDWYLHLMFASKGKIKYIKETMSVYRRNQGGVWNDIYENFQKHVCRFCIRETNMYYQVYKNIAKKKKEYFIKNLFPFFMSEQYYILSSKEFGLWLKYNLVHYQIYLLCFKYWYYMPMLIINTIKKLIKKFYKNIIQTKS